MANPKTDTRKKADPAFEKMKEQAAAYEELKKKVASFEEMRIEADEYEEMKRQARAFEELRKRTSPSYPEDLPYSAQLITLREKLDMLASSSNSDLNEIAQCINAITYFENQQIKKVAEIRKDTQKTPVFFSDNQSILQTSSVRKKDKEALVIAEPVHVNSRT